MSVPKNGKKLVVSLGITEDPNLAITIVDVLNVSKLDDPNLQMNIIHVYHIYEI